MKPRTQQRNKKPGRSAPDAPSPGTGSGLQPNPGALLQRFLDENSLELVQGLAQEKTEGGKVIIAPTLTVRHKSSDLLHKVRQALSGAGAK